MSRGRLEAFSDGVIAIIITIMVLELSVPEGSDISALIPLMPIFLSYMLSFIFIGIYWNNHHHLLQLVNRIDGRVLWANLHLLFWLSLIPFVTGWMGENPAAAWPVALYGIILFLASVAFYILAHLLVVLQGKESTLATALGGDFKGRVSMVIYLLAIPLAFINTTISFMLFVLVAIIWLIPDRRIEKFLT